MATWGLRKNWGVAGISWLLRCEMLRCFPLEDGPVHINSTQTGKTVGAEFLLCSDDQ